MLDLLKNIPRKKLELALSVLVIAVAVVGAGVITYVLFQQTQEAKIAIKGGSLGASKGGGGPSRGGGGTDSGRSVAGAGDAAGAGEGGAGEAEIPAAPDPALTKSSGQRQADTAREASARGDHQAALTYYKAALADEPDNPAYLKGAGEAALKSGDYDQAESFLRKAVSGHRAAGGKEGDDGAIALANNLSRALLAKGNAGEAERVIAASVAAQERRGLRYGESLASWAEAAHASGKPDVALTAARDGAALFKKEGPLNPHYVALLQLTARMAVERENYAAAETALKEELVVAERKNGRDSEAVARVLTRYALLDYRQRKFGEAHERNADALAIVRRVYPAGSELESDTLRTQAMIDETLYPGQVAERLLREARRLDLRIHGVEHWRSAESAVLLARYLAGAGQYLEAEALYVSSLGVWKDGAVDDLTAAGWMVTFGDLLEKMGRDQEAAEMRRLSGELGMKAQGRPAAQTGKERP